MAEDAALAELERALAGDPSAGYFARHARRYRHDLAWIRREHRGGPLLEAGALPCHLTFCLARMGVAVTGVDLAPERMAGFIERHALPVLRCDLEREALPFPAASFSTIVLLEVFEHLRIDPLFTLGELARVLAPDGKLLLSTPNLYALGNVISFVRGRGVGDPVAEFGKLRSAGHMGHVREYTADELRRFLERAGLAVLERRFVAHDPSWRGPAIDLALRFLPHLRPYIAITAGRVNASRDALERPARP